MNYPVEVRVISHADVSTAGSAQDIQTMRRLASQVMDILESAPAAVRVRNEWDAESAQVSLKVDPDRANLAGITNMDVAQLSHRRHERRAGHRAAGWRQEYPGCRPLEDG